MIELLLYDRFDNFLGRNRRGDSPQPTGVLSPYRFMKVQRNDLKDAGGNTAKVDKRFDGICGLPDQPLFGRIGNGRQIACRSFSDARPGIGPESVKKHARQVF